MKYNCIYLTFCLAFHGIVYSILKLYSNMYEICYIIDDIGLCLNTMTCENGISATLKIEVCLFFLNCLSNLTELV